MIIVDPARASVVGRVYDSLDQSVGVGTAETISVMLREQLPLPSPCGCISDI